MALLTEEQINDILDITNVWESGIIVSNLIEWNEKQPSTQFKPDWDTAPKWADKATIMVRWDGIGQTDTVTLSKSKRPATPHPHAALIAKFAEVAARRVDPWREFEYKNSVSGNWEKTISTISFFHDAEYRYIGDNK